jgi:glutamine amidotransferase
MISILNYGMGNVGSIQNMLKKVGVPSRIIATADDIGESQALIIPGVGHMDNAMQRLDSLGLRSALDDAAMARRIPILGICLGMQMMTRGSEEGKRSGLGWVRAEATRIDGAAHGLRVPHMGWNIAHIRKSSPCFDGDGIAEHRFYFVHSYAVQCDDPADILTTTDYGTEFVSAFQCGNLTGVQFHPEKSHKFGESFFRHYAATMQDTGSSVVAA